jgi:soluble lytic murein transglycosylase
MRVAIRSFLVGLSLLPAGAALAQTGDPLAAIQADRWTEAQALAAKIADPVAQKLVTYFRLRAPGAATAAEIAGFMRLNPDWPQQSVLERRRQEAIATDPDDAAVLAQCASPPSFGPAMLRCAEAIANAGRSAEAAALARKAWVEAIDTPAGEATFLARWAGNASPEDQWARFRRLAWSDTAAAARQADRLDPAHRQAAEARLAARNDDPRAQALANALPEALRTDSGLALDRARALRRASSAADAAALLIAVKDTENPPVFWAERKLTARKLIHDGDPKTAFAVAAAHGQTADEQRADADFLTGFIALRLLHDPDRAEPFFQSLARSPAVITQARAHYWLARTALAQGRDPKPEYEKSAAYPTAFYGQLAILSLGQRPADRIAALKDPPWTADAAKAFAGHEMIHAAAWLAARGDLKRARPFVIRMDELAAVPAERALTASFAIHAGMPDGAVFVARRMGRDGIALPKDGWPVPYSPAAPPDPAFSLGIMRQESSFDPGAISPSGARGLMQLMPPTAKAVAKQIGVPAAIPSLTTDTAYNIRLGTAYLAEMLTKFDNCQPLAAAAYNAGPARVAQWLSENGDPRTGPIDMVDWIELIPVAETRNYVQRVTENVVMYRTARKDMTPVMAQTPWTR